MPVLYTLALRKKADGTKTYHGRVINPNIVNLETLSKKIEANCTVKEADVLAVLKELTNVMRDELQNSNIVKLDGFGTFRVSMQTKGVADAKDFTNENIKRLKVNFLPTGKFSAANNKVTRNFLEGVKIKRY